MWATCTASVRAIERARAAGDIGPDTSSEAADEGTAAHQIREECLSLGLDAYDFIGTSVVVNGRAWQVTREMAEALQPGIDWIRERVPAGAPMMVEQRVRLDPWLPGQFGTIDCAFVWTAPSGVRELILSDLKFGFGAVEAENNLQQQIYALGALALLYGDSRDRWPTCIRIVIDQPRKGGLKEWTIDLSGLVLFGDWIAARGAEALSGEGVFRPSPKACEWCPLAEKPSLCAARTRWALTEVLDELEDLDGLDDAVAALPAPFDLTPERVAKVITHAPAIKAWLGAVFAEGSASAHAGDPPPGYKLVLGDEGDREFADKEAAEAVLVSALGEAAFERKLKSYPQAEKVMKPGRKKPGHPDAWAAIKENVTRKPARPVLVPDSDKRPEYRPTEALVAELDDL